MGAFMWALSCGPPSFGRDCRLGLALRRQESLGFECSHAALPSRGHRLAIYIVPHEEPAYSELFISHLLARKIRSGGGSGRSIVQFERETPGTDPSVLAKLAPFHSITSLEACTTLSRPEPEYDARYSYNTLQNTICRKKNNDQSARSLEIFLPLGLVFARFFIR